MRVNSGSMVAAGTLFSTILSLIAQIPPGIWIPILGALGGVIPVIVRKLTEKSLELYSAWVDARKARYERIKRLEERRDNEELCSVDPDVSRDGKLRESERAPDVHSKR